MKAGVYNITHLASGKRYIGSSVDIPSRFRAHRRMLRKGKHQNVHLQRAWDKYGEAAFTFHPVESCFPESCRNVEQRHLDAANPDGIFNIALDAHRGAGRWGRLGKKNTPEHRAKISVANRGRPSHRKGKTHGWGHKAGATQIENLPFRIRAEHLDGAVLMFDSVRLAAEGTGLKRKSVSNILNRWKGQTQTRTGWGFTKIPKEG
jgi:group I intron endonuclease